MAFDTDHGSFNHHDADQDVHDGGGEDVASDDDRANTSTDRPVPVSPPASRCLDSALIHQALQAVRRRRRLAIRP